MENIISTFNIVSFISAIVSVVLSIVAIIFTVLFYFLSKKENEIIAVKAQSIETQTGLLKVLFDKMLNTSINMIKDNSDRIHEMLMKSVGQTSSVAEKEEKKKEDSQGNVL